jgi:hypothetical protein
MAFLRQFYGNFEAFLKAFLQKLKCGSGSLSVNFECQFECGSGKFAPNCVWQWQFECQFATKWRVAMAVDSGRVDSGS